MPELGRINIFYSYSHKDEAYRERLVEWLAVLRDEGVINDWHDRKIVPGANWSGEIAANLERSHIVLLLISPAFLQSKYSMDVEVERALELHWERRCRIVPIVVHPTPGWTDRDFGTFQGLPKDGKPISTWPRQEVAFAEIAEGIRKVCKEIVDWENPYRRANVGDWNEIEQTFSAAGQRVVSKVRVELTAMDQLAATVHTVGSARALETGAENQLECDFRIPLDSPLEDNLQTLLKQFRTQMPPNASFSRQESGRGEEKVFVGGTPYYCTWWGNRLRFDASAGGTVFDCRTWRCIDVPLDGIVKAEGVCRTAAGQVLMQTDHILTGFGHGTGRPTRPVASR